MQCITKMTSQLLFFSVPQHHANLVFIRFRCVFSHMRAAGLRRHWLVWLQRWRRAVLSESASCQRSTGFHDFILPVFKKNKTKNPQRESKIVIVGGKHTGWDLIKREGAQEVQKAKDLTEKHLKSFAPCVLYHVMHGPWVDYHFRNPLDPHIYSYTLSQSLHALVCLGLF